MHTRTPAQPHVVTRQSLSAQHGTCKHRERRESRHSTCAAVSVKTRPPPPRPTSLVRYLRSRELVCGRHVSSANVTPRSAPHTKRTRHETAAVHRTCTISCAVHTRTPAQPHVVTHTYRQRDIQTYRHTDIHTYSGVVCSAQHATRHPRVPVVVS